MSSALPMRNAVPQSSSAVPVRTSEARAADKIVRALETGGLLQYRDSAHPHAWI